MSEYRVAARYAKSILDLSIEQKSLDAVLSDMKTFANIVTNSGDMRNLLASPIVPGDKKLAVVKHLFEKHFQPLTIKFFEIIIRKKREGFLGTIAKGFIEQYNQLNNIANATVKSAIELSDAVIDEIKGHIESQTGQKINISATVEPELIGGIVVQVGDKLFDASIAGKLGKLKQELLNSYISK
jgi:F-type H+-transporting ATPase subunit delta